MSRKTYIVSVVLSLLLTVLIINKINTSEKVLSNISFGSYNVLKTFYSKDYEIVLYDNFRTDSISLVVIKNGIFGARLVSCGSQTIYDNGMIKYGYSTWETYLDKSKSELLLFGSIDLNRIDALIANINGIEYECTIDEGAGIWYIHIDVSDQWIESVVISSFNNALIYYELEYEF
ncbi:MAG: hypothetical protein IBX70_08435 [Clostridia bacterium]|nr:hypothetical protein [Clostridia bacterium]